MFGITDEEIKSLVSVIDYSEVLTITATKDEVQSACEDAKLYGFRAVVAFPQYLGVLVDALEGTNVRAQIPVGFQCGGVTTLVKCNEAEQGLKRGATDLDMVMNLSAFQEGHCMKSSLIIVGLPHWARIIPMWCICLPMQIP